MDYTVNLKRTITESQILDSLTNCWDSGVSNYWIETTSRRPYEGGWARRGKDGGMTQYALVLPVEVTTLEDCEVEGERHFVLDTEAIQRGLKAMAAKRPKMFEDEFPANPDDYNGDANSSDSFLQFCLFGAEIFG